MYDYHADIIWGIDRVLLIAVILLGVFDVLYSVIKEKFENRSAEKLAIIKKNLEDLAQTAPETIKNACPVIIGKVNPQQLFEIARDRELTAAKEFERELKGCFADVGRINEIEKAAKSSGNKWHRIQAIISLGYADSRGALKILKNSIEDKDEDVSYFSMLALGQIKSYPSAKILIDCLENHRYSGNKIVSLLTNFPPEAIDAAIEAAETKDSVASFWVIKLISRFKFKKYLRRMEALADEGPDDVRAAACECLGKIGAPEARDALIRRLDDKVWFVRMHAVRALREVLGKECVPEIVGLIKDETWLVRDTVKKTMVYNIETSLPYIEKLIDEDDKAMGKDCVEVLEDAGYLKILFKDLLSEDAQLKKKAARLLTDIIRWGAHLGLESTLIEFGREQQRHILRSIAAVDEALSEHIDKKIKHQLVES